MKLNSLFGKVADRNEMGIRADKLFQLILKMDTTKFKVEWYRQKLGIALDHTDDDDGDGGYHDGGARKDGSRPRIISRGPFIAIFKHESITFVNALENVSRPLINRRRKRMSKGRTSSSVSSSSGIHTNRYTVKSAPVKNGSSNEIACEKMSTETNSSNHGADDASSASSKLSKRLKCEDRTGMIIFTKIEDDAISTVSTSPTSTDGSTTATLPSPTSETSTKPFSLGNHGNMSTPSRRSVAARRSRSSRKSSRKSRKEKRRESLRPVKSIGERIVGHQGDQDDAFTAVSSLFSDKTPGNHKESLKTSPDKGHDRWPSNTDTVDIREVLHEYSFPEDGNNCNYCVPTYFQSSDMIHQCQLVHSLGQHGHITATSQSRFPCNNNSYFISQNAPRTMPTIQQTNTFPYVCWEGAPHPICTQYPCNTQIDHSEHDECLLLKGIASFIKKLFGLEKTKELFVKNTSTAVHNHFLHGTPNKWDPYREYGDFQAPNRPRTRSRVFSDSSADTVKSGDAVGLEPEMQASQLHKDKRDGRCSMVQQNFGQCKNTLDTGFYEQAWINWKAGGPKINNKQGQCSIIDDFTLERPSTYYKKDVDTTKNEIATKKVTVPRGKNILKERNYNKEKFGRPQSVSIRSKTEGTLGTRYSSIASNCKGNISGNPIQSATSQLGNYAHSGNPVAGYFHYR
jgi:hypothetical protein